ncbi:MAG: hypothetical protein COT73_11230 [Bdellovibrio sp. CG10_big_fil_rev_8_21_14_0_10_47_8]|nr:MAG: hypothetical protein COT73_11230 [Bdellovibrio sp. CG10_big_fil_rev_8_21_14_0_10_47_8]
MIPFFASSGFQIFCIQMFDDDIWTNQSPCPAFRVRVDVGSFSSWMGTNGVFSRAKLQTVVLSAVCRLHLQIDMKKQKGIPNTSQTWTSVPANRLKNFGGEMLSWTNTGARVGAVVGFIAGLILVFLLRFRLIESPGLEQLNAAGMIIFPLIFLLGSVFFGALAGALVGAGVPKFNPHPHQGAKKENR